MDLKKKSGSGSGKEHLISQNAFKTQFNLLYVGGWPTEFKFP